MSSSSAFSWHSHLSAPASLEVSAALLAHQSQQDPAFAEALRENPKATLEKLAQGRKLPESLRIDIHDNSDDTWHLPLPQEAQANQTLDSEQLDKIAAGEVGVGVVTGGVLAVIAGIFIIGGAATGIGLSVSGVGSSDS